MTTNSNDKSSGPPQSSGNFIVIFLLAIVIAGAFYYFAQNVGEIEFLGDISPSRGGLAVGETAPEIKVAGWVDGEAPDLSGKVVVVDAWATWCLPCREEAPHMVETWQKFADRDDVIFIGLTIEQKESLPAIENFLDEFKITWPNAYGALETLIAFQAETIPAAWVINKQGIITWSFYTPNGVEMADAIQEALSEDNKK